MMGRRSVGVGKDGGAIVDMVRNGITLLVDLSDQSRSRPLRRTKSPFISQEQLIPPFFFVKSYHSCTEDLRIEQAANMQGSKP